MIYTTMELYGTEDLSFLAGEIPFIQARIDKIEEAKTKENEKHWKQRRHHLITKMNSSQSFWRDKIKDIEKGNNVQKHIKQDM